MSATLADKAPPVERVSEAVCEAFMSGVFEVQHPLIACHITRLRDETTPPAEFRQLVNRLASLLAYEATKDLLAEPVMVQTPLAKTEGRQLAQRIGLIPILRAGLGMLEGMLRVVPEAGIGHIGIYRDEETLRPVPYFSRLPTNMSAAQVVLVDPMLATGNSACEAVSALKAQGAKRIQFLCLVACPPGIAQLQSTHPDVSIFTAAIDPELNNVGYIVPGLGDAGDRYFGTG